MDPSPSPAIPPRVAQKWLISLTLSLGTLSVALSVTSINIAIPTMMVSLGTTLDKISWVLTAFMITRTVLIPSVGWLGGRIGDRNLFILSTALFTAGSFLCSVAWDVDSLIFFRIVQAIGAGPLIAVAMSIMFEAFPPHERGLSMGLFMTGWSIGPFLGPIVGGYLVEHVHWRAIFYLNIPVGLLSVVVSYLILPRKTVEKQNRQFDFLGFLTLSAGTTMLLLALSQGRELGWGSQVIVSLFGLSALLFLVFIVAELRATNPYIELRHFSDLNFGLTNVIIFFRVLAFRGANFLVSLFLQRGLNYTPVQAGIFLLPGAVMTGVVSPLAGILSDRLGPKIPILAGFVIIIGAFYGLSTLTIWTGMSTILLLIGIKSFGQSSLNAPLNTVALSALPEGKARMGSGIIGMSRGLGEAFGIAILSFLLERQIFLNLHSMTPPQGTGLSGVERADVLLQIRQLLVRTGEHGVGLEQRAQSLLGYSLLTEATTSAYQDLFLMMAALYVVLIGCVLFLRSGTN